jgi:hypothetical protein
MESGQIYGTVYSLVPVNSGRSLLRPLSPGGEIGRQAVNV